MVRTGHSRFQTVKSKLTPPAKEVPSDEAVENDADNDPREKIVKGSGRNEAASTKDGGPDDISSKGAGVASGDEVLNGWTSGTNEPEPVSPGVDATGTEHALWALSMAG